MKYILLSADSNPSVYLVPEIVADNLKKYCIEFNKWLKDSTDAKKYYVKGSLCYDEKDFIDYLNTYVFPDKLSLFIETLGWIDSINKIPEKYKSCEWFNF